MDIVDRILKLKTVFHLRNQAPTHVIVGKKEWGEILRKLSLIPSYDGEIDGLQVIRSETESCLMVCVGVEESIQDTTEDLKAELKVTKVKLDEEIRRSNFLADMLNTGVPDTSLLPLEELTITELTREAVLAGWGIDGLIMEAGNVERPGWLFTSKYLQKGKIFRGTSPIACLREHVSMIRAKKMKEPG